MRRARNSGRFAYLVPDGRGRATQSAHRSSQKLVTGSAKCGGWYPQRWLHRSDFAARMRRTGLGPDPEIKPVRYVNRAEPSWKSKRMTTVTNDRAMDLEVLVLVVGDDGSCQCRSTTQGLGKKPSARTRRGVGACVLLLPHRKRTPNLRRMRWAGCLSRVGRERGGGFMPVRFAQSSRPVPKLCDP